MNFKERAEANFGNLECNPYPGRGIVLGQTPDGNLVQIYWIMGRSAGSRNRILELIPDKHGWLRTQVADESKVSGDKNLLIYAAMAEEDETFVVSNGAQTDAVIQNGISVLYGGDWQYEPDEPNFTPRITGITYDDPLDMCLVMLRKSRTGDKCDCFSYVYGEVAPGYGYFISTYEDDGDPLPAFNGEPLILPIGDNNLEEIAKTYWSALDESNRVALAVKIIPPVRPSEIKIINRHVT